jgi:hypothetical protein
VHWDHHALTTMPQQVSRMMAPGVCPSLHHLLCTRRIACQAVVARTELEAGGGEGPSEEGGSGCRNMAHTIFRGCREALILSAWDEHCASSAEYGVGHVPTLGLHAISTKVTSFICARIGLSPT